MVSMARSKDCSLKCKSWRTKTTEAARCRCSSPRVSQRNTRCTLRSLGQIYRRLKQRRQLCTGGDKYITQSHSRCSRGDGFESRTIECETMTYAYLARPVPCRLSIHFLRVLYTAMLGSTRWAIDMLSRLSICTSLCSMCALASQYLHLLVWGVRDR